MEQRAGAQIGKKAFIQSLVILLVLMVAAGVYSPSSFQQGDTRARLSKKERS